MMVQKVVVVLETRKPVFFHAPLDRRTMHAACIVALSLMTAGSTMAASPFRDPGGFLADRTPPAMSSLVSATRPAFSRPSPPMLSSQLATETPTSTAARLPPFTARALTPLQPTENREAQSLSSKTEGPLTQVRNLGNDPLLVQIPGSSQPREHPSDYHPLVAPRRALAALQPTETCDAQSFSSKTIGPLTPVRNLGINPLLLVHIRAHQEVATSPERTGVA